MVPQQQRRRRRRVALPRTAERRVVIGRGAGGFGFTIAGQRPCVVSAVAPGGPAERAGLRAGDALLAVDGASVARAPHASVARLVAAAPGAIALSVAPRESPPTDTEDTEPDERVRTRRRHPPPRRRPQAIMHHPACQAVPSTSGVNEILQNLSRAQLTPHHAARLECRAVVGYLGTIETPQAASTSAPSNVRSAVRKLRQERRPATPVLLSVLPNVLLLRRPSSQVLAQYHRERILYAGCGSDADRRFFGLVTSAEPPEADASLSCHIFAADPRAAEHAAHCSQAAEFHIACTRDPVAERCLEFPPSAEYVVGVIRGMYSLPPDECTSPALQHISKLAVRGDSPGIGKFARCNRGVFRPRRQGRHEEGQGLVASSPQPSSHSEVTTASSNSDSGIGFHNDCNVADRILVVDFAGPQPPPNRFRQDTPRRPMGLVGCSSFDAEASFLSNTTPVVDGFGGQGRPLNLDDIMLNANDLQPVRQANPRNEEDNYNYNNIYGNFPSTSRGYNGVVYDYDQVYTENEHHYELLPSQDGAETFHSVEMYEEPSRNADCQSNESVESVTVVSGGTSKASVASVDSVSVYSSRSHEEPREERLSRRHLQASLDDMLVLGMRDRDRPPANDKHDGTFLHPASVKFKIRKSIHPLNILTRTKHMLTGRDKKEERRRAISASAGDVAGGAGGAGGEGGAAEQHPLPAAASEPDLRDTQSEQSSPFRRWTTGSGGGSSYRHTDHRTIYKKPQMSEGSGTEAGCSRAMGGAQVQWANGGVTCWSISLHHLLKDPVGRAAFAEFLAREIALENIIFWTDCEEYNQEQDPVKRSALAARIWKRHLEEHASQPVNVDADGRRAVGSRINEDPLPQDLFQEAQRQIYNLMRLDSYRRFLRSSDHAIYARAYLQGLPPPQPYSLAAGSSTHSRSATPPPDFSGTCNNSEPITSSKLKKSVSNASERRRSGGNSLLPWKLRVPSRERAAAQMAPGATPSLAAGGSCFGISPGNATGLTPGLAAGIPCAARDASPSSKGNPHLCRDATAGSTQRITDVVKSGALCRVVLPDGATSVVGVEERVPVRRLVERLLQRRNLLQNAYDVIYKDVPEGSGAVVDVNAPSSVLGGREVVVERRCVVRMEVCGRVVAVRCRPARRLRHVLKPVLARYAPPHPGDPPADLPPVLREGVLLHPDTPMLDLDGARLHIVAGGDDCLVASVQRRGSVDDDGDSLSELALRCADEPIYREEQPVGKGAGADDGRVGARSAGAAAAGPPETQAAGEGAAPLAPAPPPPPAALLPPSAAGRVRAALRPGPPLHSHPPSFLENLRETQRQRQQSKGEPSSSARAPPPLPPKPPTRAPTLV